jgi:hypothetical protein
LEFKLQLVERSRFAAGEEAGLEAAHLIGRFHLLSSVSPRHWPTAGRHTAEPAINIKH